MCKFYFLDVKKVLVSAEEMFPICLKIFHIYETTTYIPSLLAFAMFGYVLPLNVQFLSNLNAHKVKEELRERGVSFSLI